MVADLFSGQNLEMDEVTNTKIVNFKNDWKIMETWYNHRICY